MIFNICFILKGNLSKLFICSGSFLLDLYAFLIKYVCSFTRQTSSIGRHHLLFFWHPFVIRIIDTFDHIQLVQDFFEVFTPTYSQTKFNEGPIFGPSLLANTLNFYLSFNHKIYLRIQRLVQADSTFLSQKKAFPFSSYIHIKLVLAIFYELLIVLICFRELQYPKKT